MIRAVLLVLMLFGAVYAKDVRLAPTPYNFAKISIGMGTPVFLEIGSEHCKPCVEMGEILYNVKQKFPDAKIYYISVDNDKEFLGHLDLVAIPTQIIYDAKGKEVYRHLGELNFMEVQKVLSEYGLLSTK